MRNVLVTGANKGIGLAIVRGALTEHPDAFVWLGARDAARGEAARSALVAERPDWAPRVEVLPLDVVDPATVERAAATLGARGVTLHGLVNNAGIAHGTLAAVLAVNVRGLARVTAALLPRIAPAGGRIVNVTSASGPMFVARCEPPWQRFFVDASIDGGRLQAFVEECIAAGDAATLAARGLGDGEAYGLSKACANLFTLLLAREHPALVVNACTPGYIETDLTRPHALAAGKTPAELGMKPPAEGARAPLALLFGEPMGSGHYYGSDAQRSPLDRYRAPGSAPYTGP